MNKLFRNIIHYIITIYILIGGLISNNCISLYIHFCFCILVILHWLTNNNKCFLSEYDYDDSDGYTKSILNFFNIDVSKYDNPYLITNIIAYSIVIIPLLFTLYKLNKYYCFTKYIKNNKIKNRI